MMRSVKVNIHILCLLLAVVLLLTNCSDGSQFDESPVLPPLPASQQSNADSLYLHLQIVNSTQPVMRAAVAATKEENAVYDGILAIFEGTSESTATLRSAVVIDQLINNPGSTDHPETVSVIQRLPIQTNPYTNTLYALVLLNTTASGFTISNGMLFFDGVSQSGKTRSQIQALNIKGIGSTDMHKGLFMSNAPTSTDGTTLVAISALYDTDAAARSGTAHTITVERAAAKVSVASGYSAGSNITAITLNGGASYAHYHTMTWAVNKYNTTSYALRNPNGTSNWAQDINYSGAPEHTFTANDFTVYPQQSHSNDVVYIAENTTNDGSSSDVNVTEVIVEVQVKDASNMLIHEGFKFTAYDNNVFYTSAEQYIAFLKSGLTDGQKALYSLSARTADEVYKYPTIVMNADGSVTVTLSNESFTAAEKTGLANLAAFLSNNTKGYRDGKMYYTYKIQHDTGKYAVVRNNVYSLTLSNITAIGSPTP
ncbi:MAG: fimbria major subunit [Prevotella sp.]|nr:fimbria major subunit [Prevotella sp.]